MFHSIIENIIVTAIVCALSAFFRWIFKAFKSSLRQGPTLPGRRPTRRLLVKQFYASLFSFSGCLIVGLSVHAPRPFSLLGFAKVICLIISGLCSLFVMGAFDAAASLYPLRDDGDNTQPETKPNDSGEK